MTRWTLALVGLLALCAAPRPVAAQDETTERRAVPDYGGAEASDDPAEDLLWIPRVLFFPVHVILEYGVRAPVGWFLRELELMDVGGAPDPPERRPDPWSWGIRPLFRADAGFASSFGLELWARQPVDGLDVRLGGENWGADRAGGWLDARARSGDAEVRLDVRGGWRNDRVVHGLGWDSGPDGTRYGEGRVDARLSLRQRLWRRSSLEVGGRFSWQRFEPGVGGNGALQRDALSALPGFSDGVVPVGLRARARLDTRRDAEDRFATGLAIDVDGGWSLDALRGPDASWASLSGSAELALEIMRDRSLVLRGGVDMVEPLGRGEIPFSEQVRLGGGLRRLPGFLDGRLIGASGATLGLVWRYAIWPWLDAEAFVDVGNVFARYLEDFDVARLRLSAGLLVRATEARTFTLLVAIGTEPFVNGVDVTSARLAFAIGTDP